MRYRIPKEWHSDRTMAATKFVKLLVFCMEYFMRFMAVPGRVENLIVIADLQGLSATQLPSSQYNLGDFGWTYCASYATRYATPETDRQGEIKQRFGTRHEKVWTLHSDKAVAKFQTGAKEKGTECLEKGMGSLKTAFSRAYPSANVRWTVYRCETASLPVSFFEYVEVSESDDE